MKGLGMNSDTNYKTTTSELSMLMGSSCSSHHNLENQEPKLENFLGCRSFADHEQKLQGCNSIAAAAYDSSADYMFPNCSLQLPSEPVDTPTPRGGGGGSTTVNNSSIGLSMIKTWLRNQPVPTHQDNNKSTDTGPVGGAAAGNLPNAQTLSLSMSTGSQSSSPLPLLTASAGGGGGSGGESSSSDNKKATPLDSQTGAIETVPRKSIDTFGQRTSIYRGVTRSLFNTPFPLPFHIFPLFWFVISNNDFELYVCICISTGIDGRVDMRLIYGTTVAEEKDKLEREGKVWYHTAYTS